MRQETRIILSRKACLKIKLNFSQEYKPENQRKMSTIVFWTASSENKENNNHKVPKVVGITIITMFFHQRQRLHHNLNHNHSHNNNHNHNHKHNHCHNHSLIQNNKHTIQLWNQLPR